MSIPPLELESLTLFAAQPQGFGLEVLNKMGGLFSSVEAQTMMRAAVADVQENGSVDVAAWLSGAPEGLEKSSRKARWTDASLTLNLSPAL